MGFRCFHLRELNAVSGEWTLVSLAWNLKRMHALASWARRKKSALTGPERVPSQGPKRPLEVREPPPPATEPPLKWPNPEPGSGALACCLGRNQREGFPSRHSWVKPDRLLGLTSSPANSTHLSAPRYTGTCAVVAQIG